MRLHVLAGAAVLAALGATVFAGQSALEKVSKLTNPAALNETAPATYRVNMDTSKGLVVIEVTREWAPIGADRFYNLVKNGFYDEVRFFRVIPGFMAQFGMNGNPAVQKAWQNQRLQDDPVKQGSRRGNVVFAHAGPNSRTTQLFINYADNSANLNGQGFAAIGRVVTGMDVVDKFNSDAGGNPDQGAILAQGNAFLTSKYPRMDYIKTATIAK